MERIEKSLKRNQTIFNRHIKPRLIENFFDEIWTIETDRSIAGVLLDQVCGIDCIGFKSGVCYGVDLKIQFSHDWKTFVVRTRRHSGTETTFSKLKRALKRKGALRPFYSVQCYFQGEVRGLYVAETEEIVKKIVAGDSVERECSNSSFSAVNVDSLDSLISL